MRVQLKYVYLILFAFVFNLNVFGQKQIGLNFNCGPTLIYHQYYPNPDTVSQGVGLMYDIGLSYRIYINERWNLNLSVDYGKYHGRENFEFWHETSPYVPLPSGKVVGHTTWWFKNFNGHLKVNYTAASGFGVNWGVRFVLSDFEWGRRSWIVYRPDGNWFSYSNEIGNLDFYRLNFGPTGGFHYKNKKEYFFYLFYYQGLNRLKDPNSASQASWWLGQIVCGVNIPLF